MSDSSVIDKEGRFWRIQEWFPDLNAKTLSSLRAYHSEILYFNGRMNLISPRTEKNADQIHFADAIIGAKIIFKNTTQGVIYDIGSGNGIPGIVMAILYPEKKFILVDADARKAEFLKHVCGRLELKNCSILHTRLEDIEKGSVQCAVTRGFASISKCLIMSRKAAAIKSEIYHFKGPSWSLEVASIPPQVLAFWEPSHIEDYTLPLSDSPFSIVRTTCVAI
jgi:16S rRNA (guanine527-N7)-methyltransferase